MKKNQFFSSIILSTFVMLLCLIIAFANSSWIWISETRPFDVLPWVAIFTILIEAFSINYIPKIHKLPKTFCVVTLANLLSFATPYLINFVMYRDWGFEFSKYLDHWPSYIVGIIYGIITIAIELPIVYNTLKKDSNSKKKLILTAICANAATTCLVALIERLFCRGAWY